MALKVALIGDVVIEARKDQTRMVASGTDADKVPADFPKVVAADNDPHLDHVVSFTARGLDLVLYIDAV